jgi:hypothetical protein
MYSFVSVRYHVHFMGIWHGTGFPSTGLMLLLTGMGGVGRGYGGGKKIKGRQSHLLVDTLRRLLESIACSDFHSHVGSMKLASGYTPTRNSGSFCMSDRKPL